MPGIELLAAGLEGAGLPVAKLDVVTSSSFSLAGVAALRDGGQVFAKVLTDAAHVHRLRPIRLAPRWLARPRPDAAA